MTEFSQTYWNDQLDKYKQGIISEEERYQLEKQALDDPFLFDAIEGFSLYQKVEKTERKSTTIFTLPRMAFAASLVLLVAIIFNLKSNLNTKIEDDQTFAMVLDHGEVTPDTQRDILAVEESLQDDESASTATTQTSESTQEEFLESVKPRKANNNSIDNSIDESFSKTKVESPISPSTRKDELPDPTVIVDADIVIATKNADELRKEELSIEELVIEKEEPPLDGVSVVNDGGDVEEVVITTALNDLKEKPEHAMNIVDSQSNKRMGGIGILEEVKPLDFYDAVPIIGKEIFDDYAKGQIDERGLRQEKPQEVTIEFTIDKNGRLTNFHHIFTGCPECGSYAITILQNSGEWKTVPPGISGKARYTFIF
jgi:hypothetical protein